MVLQRKWTVVILINQSSESTAGRAYMQAQIQVLGLEGARGLGTA